MASAITIVLTTFIRLVPFMFTFTWPVGPLCGLPKPRSLIWRKVQGTVEWTNRPGSLLTLVKRHDSKALRKLTSVPQENGAVW